MSIVSAQASAKRSRARNLLDGMAELAAAVCLFDPGREARILLYEERASQRKPLFDPPAPGSRRLRGRP